MKMYQHANPNLVAHFSTTEASPTSCGHEQPIVGWSDEGRPLVWDDSRKRLREATDYANFVSVDMDCEDTFVAVLPGGGYRFRCEDDSAPGGHRDDQVSYFAIMSDGTAEAMTIDGDGWTSKVTGLSNFEYIYHPGIPGMGADA